MFSSNNKISVRQLQVFIILNGIAVALTLLPRFLANTVGNFGFLMILISGVLVAFFVSAVLSIFNRVGERDFKGVIEYAFGEKVGKVLCFIISLKMVVSGGFMLRILCEVIRETALFKTHISITALIIIGLCVYGLKGGVEGFSRLCEVIFITSLVPILIVFISAIKDTDYTNILPIFDFRDSSLLYGFIVSLSVFFGVENVFFQYSYVNRKRGTASVFLAILALSICASVSYFFTVTRFGHITTGLRTFPTITMLDTIEIAGAFIERQFVFVIWAVISSSFVFINSSLVFSQGVKRDLKSTVFFSVILFATCLLPTSLSQALSWFFGVNIFGGVFSVIILPLILCGYILLKGGRES